MWQVESPNLRLWRDFSLFLHSVSYTLFISRRLAVSAAGARRSPAVGIAVAAVALCTAVMIAAVAIVGGFTEQIRNKMLGFNASLTIYAGADDEELQLSDGLRNILDRQDYVADFGAELVVPGVIKTPEDFHGIYVKGLESATDSTFVAASLSDGAVPSLSSPTSNDILITQPTADKLGLHTGDATDIYIMSDDVRMRRVRVAGIVNTHFEAFDELHAYIPMPALRQMAGLQGDIATAIRVHTQDFDNIGADAMRLRQALASGAARGEINSAYSVSTVKDQGAAYFSWLDLLDTNVAVILVLMTIVAAATLISAMLIIILDKVAQIGTLKALGASNRAISRVFVWIALRVCVIGLIVGNAIALALLYAQEQTHMLRLDPDAYYIDFVPVHLSVSSVVLLNVGVLLAAWLALVLPSRIVAGIAPDKSMRFE